MGRASKQPSAGAAAACVLLLDCKRTRRMQLASTFRQAGCFVVEASHSHEVARTLAANQRSWVLVVVASTASQAFCDGFPGTPVVHIGGEHQLKISGRITVHDAPGLSADVHGLVAMHGGAS